MYDSDDDVAFFGGKGIKVMSFSRAWEYLNLEPHLILWVAHAAYQRAGAVKDTTSNEEAGQKNAGRSPRIQIRNITRYTTWYVDVAAEAINAATQLRIIP